MSETVLTNARVVLAEREIAGTVVLRDGLVAEVAEGRSGAAGAQDLAGDWLLPGLVELHTDNLERHFTPRPGVSWPPMAATIAHDGEIIMGGITTVYNAVALDDLGEDGPRNRILDDIMAALDRARADDALRAEHRVHLRCEVSKANCVPRIETFIDRDDVGLVSVMDHTPGQRQFVRMDKYYEYYQGKYGLNDAEMERYMAEKTALAAEWSAPNRRAVVAIARRHGVKLASHDDATPEHVAEALADGMAIAEFPTTAEAARASHAGGMAVLMGAPNLVRGGSHSGNVSAAALAEQGVLDILSSDYVPSSLLYAAFRLADEIAGFDLPRAVATVSRNPARAVGLDDRGEIAAGQRADLIRVRRSGDMPVVRAAWRGGTRMA
jgi:alpha-D-ribose 1-methylphosphonate 5-triphosphate diphosphatase